MPGVQYAGVKSRTFAMGIDLSLFLVTSPLTLSVVAIILRSFWVVGAIALGFGYCFVGALRGQSFGMQILGLRIVSFSTGRQPNTAAALAQSIITLLPMVALFTLASALTPTRETISDGVAPLLVWLSLGALVLAALDHAFAFFDDTGRSLHERMTGLMVIETQDTSRSHRPVEI